MLTCKYIYTCMHIWLNVNEKLIALEYVADAQWYLCMYVLIYKKVGRIKGVKIKKES